MSLYSEVDEPTWPEILAAASAKALRGVHTALPGRVKDYDVATQTAQVQLAVHLDGLEVPPLKDVPVCWPGGSEGFLHVPLAAGDTVLVLFAEEDFSRWFDTGSVSPPQVLARHGLHAIAIPGLRRAKDPLAVTAGHVTLSAINELRLGEDTASVFIALANLVDARITSLQEAIDTHIHPTGVGPSGVNTTPVGALATVASSKVKSV